MGIENQPISSRMALYAGIFGCVFRVGLWCVVRWCRWKLPFSLDGLFAMFTYYVWFWGVTFYLFWGVLCR